MSFASQPPEVHEKRHGLMKIREFGPAEGPLMAGGLAAVSEFQICLSACLFHIGILVGHIYGHILYLILRCSSMFYFGAYGCTTDSFIAQRDETFTPSSGLIVMSVTVFVADSDTWLWNAWPQLIGFTRGIITASGLVKVGSQKHDCSTLGIHWKLGIQHFREL